MISLVMGWLKILVHRWLFSYEYDLCIMEGGKSPIRTYKRDAGYDLFVSKSTTIKAGERRNVPTGVSMRSRIPAWLWLTGRSSTLLKYGLMIDDGIIDGDFIGELFIKAYNPTNKDIHIPPETRIAQIIVLPHTISKFNHVPYLARKFGARNDSGFGSSGE